MGAAPCRCEASKILSQKCTVHPLLHPPGGSNPAPPPQTSTLSQLLSATRIPARMRLVLAMCSPGLFEHGHNRFTELAQQLRQSRD